MNRLSCVMMALMLSGTLAGQDANTVDPSREPNLSSPAVSLVLGSLKITDQRLELRYLVRNDTGQDIWVCDHVGGLTAYQIGRILWNAEVFLDPDRQTLRTMRRCRVVENNGSTRELIVRYTQIPSGQSRVDEISINLPVSPVRMYDIYNAVAMNVYANRLTLDIGFITENLAKKIRDALDALEAKGERPGAPFTEDARRDIERWGQYQSYHILQLFNPDVTKSSDQVVIPLRAWGKALGLDQEKVSGLTIDGVRIPYNFKWTPTVLERLQGLFFSGVLDLDTYREAEQLLTCDEVLYDDTTRKLADVYTKVASGSIRPADLDQSLSMIANKENRDKALNKLRERRAKQYREKMAPKNSLK